MIEQLSSDPLELFNKTEIIEIFLRREMFSDFHQHLIRKVIDGRERPLWV